MRASARTFLTPCACRRSPANAQSITKFTGIPRRSPAFDSDPAKIKSKFHRSSTTKRISQHLLRYPHSSKPPCFPPMASRFRQFHVGTGAGNHMHIDGAIGLSPLARPLLKRGHRNISAF